MDLFTRLAEEMDIETLLFTSLRVLAIFFLVYMLSRFIKRILDRWAASLVQKSQKAGLTPSETHKRADTLVKLLRQGMLISIWVIAILVILREMGFEIAPILAGAGILGLAVGFGAQNLVRDIISGFFIIMENQVRVGDVTVINGTGGLVEALNFRTIVLRDLHGTLHVFPNGTISTLSNMTHQWSAYVFDLPVAYKEDTDRVVKIIEQIGLDLKEDAYFGPLMLDNLEIFGVDKFADSGVVIRGRIKTRPIKQWEVGRQFLRRVKKTFDSEGVEIPFPHRSIYFGTACKPLEVRLMETKEETGSDEEKR